MTTSNLLFHHTKDRGKYQGITTKLLKELWKDDRQASLDKSSLHNSLKKRRSEQETKIRVVYT